MATTRLSDVIQPEVFYNYMLERTKELSAPFSSGVIQDDANLSNFLNGGGRTANLPFWKDLVDSESNIGSDDPTSVITPQNITATKQIAIRQVRTQAWSSARLTADLAGDDPMRRIVDRVSDWWARDMNENLISILHGVYLDNVANDSNDMVNDIGGDDGTVTSSELVSAEAILDTKQTMGDAAEDLSVLIMHSVVYTRLQKQNLIDFIPDSRGEIRFPSYLGYRVVVSDRCKTIVGSNANDTKYVTYLLASGFCAHSESPLMTSPAIEVDREPQQGNGVGVDTLYTRRQFVLHPYGFKWTDNSCAGEFPTNAELALATNWDRVFPERKQVPLAFLLTNG